MSNITSRQIECLQRLQDTTGQLDEILQFLKQENLIDISQMKTIKGSSDHAKEVQQVLKTLQTANKFQLLEFEWNILPVENIRIMIITDRDSKEFTFNR